MGLFWEEDGSSVRPNAGTDSVLDMSYRIDCRSLPVDHAQALASALGARLPWLLDDAVGGIHQIHVAASGNGWQRPQEDEEGALLHLSRRTRLQLRLARARLQEAQALSGMTLDVAGHSLCIGAATEKPFSPSATLYARYVLSCEQDDEAAFLQQTLGALQAKGVRIRKALCGKSHTIQTADGAVFARSLMLADLAPEDSLLLQQTRIGEGHMLGCGLLIPHKGIEAIKQPADEAQE